MRYIPSPQLARHSKTPLFSLLLVGHLLGLLNGAAGAATHSEGAAHSANVLETTVSPLASRAFPKSVGKRLEAAFAAAHATITHSADCKKLFDRLHKEPQEALSTTYYAPPLAGDEERFCTKRVAAFTTIGGRVTFLCRRFALLPTPQAARILIHEALHHAGLEESPTVPNAPSSAQINQEVARHCAI